MPIPTNERVAQLRATVAHIRPIDNSAIHLLVVFDEIREELRQLGALKDDYDLVAEFLDKFDPQGDYAQAIYYSLWDTYDGMKENFTTAQQAIEEARIFGAQTREAIDAAVDDAVAATIRLRLS